MALTTEERDRVAELLEAHPDWRTGQIRDAAGLGSRQLFAVKALRDKLGVPEPESAGGTPKAPGRRRGGRPRKAGTERLEADTPDGDTPMPTPGKSAGKGFKSLFAPVLPTAIKAGAGQLIQLSGRVTHNPMTVAEAMGTVAPVGRIFDRFLAKYIKVSEAKLSPDAEDARDAVVTLAMYVFRIVVENMAARMASQAASSSAPSMGPMAHTPSVHVTMPTGMDSDDLFAGSEPAPMAPGAATPVAEPDAPPAAPRPAPTQEGRRLAAEGIAGPHAGPVDDAYWNSITPTNLGNYEAP